MACNSTVEKNQNFTSSKDVEKKVNDQDYIWSCRWENYRHEGPSNLKQKMKGTFQSTELMDQKNIFRNYKRKRKDESRSSSSTSKFIRTNSPSIPLIPPRASASTGGFRRVSFLERALFPGVNVDAVLPAPTPTEESKTAQLTIFYAGVINVYDDVPLDKAHAIMLMATQSCLSPSPPIIFKHLTKSDDDVVKSVPKSESPSSLCSWINQQDLPISRRQSLRSFLDKRRNRIISKYPYEGLKMTDKQEMQDKSFSSIV